MTDRTDHPPVPQAFAALGLRNSLLLSLADLKFETPSEIQQMLIPRALAGVDILGQARTGTGKTAAFGLPILQKAQKGLGSQALILVPTRELAVQVDEEIKRLAGRTPLRSLAVYGGQKIAAQLKHLKNHPEILVGTPGRVIDLLDRWLMSLENIQFVVLDEVDRMLDIGFREDIRNILSRVRGVRRKVEDAGPGGDSDQPTHQTIFVSATISDEIDKLARRYMREPVEKLIAPGSNDKPTVAEVEQYYLSVQPWDKYRILKMLLLKENPDLAIVFTRTKHGAEKLAHRLGADGIECREIHGNLAQNKRDRVMKGFKGGKFDVLIATDLASRGIDVADISHIINYDIPEDPEAYVHRVGRTARMGAQGKAFTLVTNEQGDELTKIENLINMVIPAATVDGFEPRPAPSDWTANKPGAPTYNATKPIVNRMQRAWGSTPAPSDNSGGGGNGQAPQPVTLPTAPRTLGSKIPINRRHRRRR